MSDDGQNVALPTLPDIEAAARRMAPWISATPVRRYGELERLLGATLFLKCEQHQKTGAFKARGALNAVWSLSAAEAARGVVTHSSGNHGAALAYAAATRGITAHVVMPEGSARCKVRNVEQAGGTVHFCAPTQRAREALAARLQRELGAVFVSPYADPRVIAGQGTVALELWRACGPLDVLLVPVGGGGLASGCAIALHALDARAALVAAEPEGAAETLASLAAGHRVTTIRPDTLCDGLRATLGEINFRCLRRHHVEVLAVSDAQCCAELQAIRARLGEVIEPSSATVLAALRRYRARFRSKRIGVILTGGNVDRDAL